MVPQAVNMDERLAQAEASLKQASDTTKTETFATIDTTISAQKLSAC